MAKDKSNGADRGDYEVGHGKPPKEHRFKPGQSGNSKGRPKGLKNLKTVLEREMKRKVDVREGGKIKRMTKLEALPVRLFAQALNGDMRATSKLLDLILRLFPPDQLERANVPLPVDDYKVLKRFIALLQSNKEGEG